MTKLEYGKCKKLMEEAIRKTSNSKEDYKAYERLRNERIIRAAIDRVFYWRIANEKILVRKIKVF